MYGIEYQTIANLIKDDETEDDYTHIKTINSTSESSRISNTKFNSLLTEHLVTKLQNLKKCPDYLLTKTKQLNRSTSVTSSVSNTSNSNISSACKAN